MLAFQLAGALILLINCSKADRKAVIKNCFPGSNIAERDDDNICTISKEKLQNSAHKIYLNIVAFADLVIGYGLAAFSPVATYQTCQTVIGVAISTIALLFIEYFLSLVTARKIYHSDLKVDYSELEENDVDTDITIKELNDMLSGVLEG